MNAENVLKRRIFDILMEIGMSTGVSGFKYSMEAIQLLMKDDNLSITKELYPSIAKKFDSTPSRVERGIRHAISIVFQRGKTEVLEKYFGTVYAAKTVKITNTEFLKTIAYILQLEE